MSPVRKQDVTITSMVTKDIDTMIFLGLVVSFFLVGVTITIVVYCFVIKRRRKAVSTECLATPIDTSCSYVHYGSPGNSIRATRRKRKKTERKDSEYSYSLYSSNNSSSDIGDEFMSFRDESPAPPIMQLKVIDDRAKTEIEEQQNEATCVEVGKDENYSQGLNTCRNLSFNLSELGLTGSSDLNPTSLQITASTSLCEQCLSPPPSPPPMLGTSISLPPTTVEITKTALGISTHVVPAVCDTCLSPSKLGDTTRSLNLPIIGIENIRQRKMSPSGIITNPRVKNPMLTTLRETMSNDQLSDLFVNIDVDEKSDTAEEKDLQENSFDSLLSPSRACEWLSSDPFELSSDEQNSPNDPRMVKINPVIKRNTKGARNETSGRRGRSEDFNLPIKTHDKPCYTRSSSCYEASSTGLITPPLRNQSRSNNMAKDIFTFPGLRPGGFTETPVQFQKFPLQEIPTLSPHLMLSPVFTDKFPLIPPPSPFRSTSTSPKKNSVSSIISVENNSIANITPNKSALNSQFPSLVTTPLSQSKDSSMTLRRMHSSTAVKPRLHSSIPSCSSTAINSDTEVFDSSFSKTCHSENPSHLAWDSTFETLKTLECSMKLELTPLQKKVVEEYEDSPHDSNDSQISQCPVDKSCVSSMSLAWDNTGEVLAVTAASPESLNSSLQSMDIDEIIGRVAPNLSQPDCGIIQNDTSTNSNCFQVTMIPFLKRSATSIDMDALLDMQDDNSSCESSCKNVEAKSNNVFQSAGQRKNESLSQVFPFNCPSPHSHAPVFVFPSSMSSSDTVPCDRSPTSGSHHSSTIQPCSPDSCVSEDFLSTRGSMDSFSTVFEM